MTPFSPRVTTSSFRPLRRMPLLRDLAEDHRLAVLQPEHRVVTQGLVGGVLEDVVVEDHAVLIDLDERRALVSGRSAESLDHVFGVNVHRPRDERGLGGQRDGKGPQWIVDRPARRRFRLRADPRRRRELALRQAVNLVIEEDDLQVDVAAECVNEVVAADGQPVAVAGDYPDLKIGPGHLEPGGNGRSPAVDRVETKGVHVIREPAGAADARDEDQFIAVHPQRGNGLAPGPGPSNPHSRDTSGLLGRWSGPWGSGPADYRGWEVP